MWTTDGPTRSESLWFGESYDARLDQAGWNAAGFDGTGWRPAVGVTGPAGTLALRCPAEPQADRRAPASRAGTSAGGHPAAGRRGRLTAR